MQTPTKEQLKERAKHLTEMMQEKYGVKVKHGHSLEIISKIFGAKDWNTASALSTKAAKTTSEKPIAAKLLKAGELADFFGQLDRETEVFVNEYHMKEGEFETVVSVCSLTFDSEIQNGTAVHLELNTEEERMYQLQNFSKSANQTFEKTTAGRFQRRMKYLNMLKDFWNTLAKSDSRSNL